MASDTVKCPYCLGDKPAEARVCLHCGRDEQGFGPMVRSGHAVMVSDRAIPRIQQKKSDLRIHALLACMVTVVGFLLMLSSGLGALLFAGGLLWLASAKARMWWRGQRGQSFWMLVPG
jgi:hypothetical protein